VAHEIVKPTPETVTTETLAALEELYLHMLTDNAQPQQLAFVSKELQVMREKLQNL